MMASKILRCYTYGVDTLELQMIKTILKKHDLPFTDITPILKEYSDEELCRYMARQLEDGVVCLMPNVPLERMRGQPYLEDLTVLRTDAIPGGMAVLAQICAIIGHQPTRYENLVCSFATGHIKGLREAGATEEEVRQIALRDRLARGGSLEDERVVAQYIDNLQPIRSSGGYLTTEVVFHQGEDSILADSERRRAFIDYVLCQADAYDTVTIVVDEMNENYQIVRAEVYTSDISEFKAARRAGERYRFIVSAPAYDQQTGMHVFHFSATEKSRCSGGIRELIRKCRRPRW